MLDLQSIECRARGSCDGSRPTLAGLLDDTQATFIYANTLEGDIDFFEHGDVPIKCLENQHLYTVQVTFCLCPCLPRVLFSVEVVIYDSNFDGGLDKE